MKKFLLILLAVMLVFSACDTSLQPDAAVSARPRSTTAGNVIMPSHISQADMLNQLTSYYETWKADYVEPSTVLPHGYYVYMIGVGAGAGKTTSEAHGYGMIISALMEDKHTFDGMYKFFDAHRSTTNDSLMSWTVAFDENPASDTGSATDGDMDIAYALLLAHDRWGSDGAINYKAEAVSMLTWGIKVDEMAADTKRVMMGDWDLDSYSTRASDWMTGHFIAYSEATGDTFWNEAADTAFWIIEQIRNNYSPQTGLMPDFVVEAQPQPAPEWYLGEFKETDEYNWNACRFPLRMAADYAHYGTPEAKTAVTKILNWLKPAVGYDPAAIIAGYTLDGYPLADYTSNAFAAPIIAASISDPAHQDFLNAGWDLIANSRVNYYEDSLSLLSMLLISGKWTAPGSGSIVVPETVSITASAGPNGSISPAGVSTVTKGSTFNFSVAADAGYEVDRLYINDVPQELPYSYSIPADADTSIYVTFKKSDIVVPQYKVTITHSAGGVVSPRGIILVNGGDSVSITAAPDSGYAIDDMTKDGISLGAVSSFTFEVNADTNVHVDFVLIAGPCSYATYEHGKTYVGGDAVHFEGRDYRAKWWTQWEAPPGSSGVWEDLGECGPVTITYYDVSASAGPNGSISPAGTNTVEKGTAVTYVITPDSGYEIDSLIVNGVNQAAVSQLNIVVESDTTVAVSFKKTVIHPVYYSVTASAGANGSISPAGVSSVLEGDSITYTITADVGYNIDVITVNGVAVGSESSHTISNVAADTAIHVSFKMGGTTGDIPEWQSGVAYKLGDKVLYNGVVYECKYAHTSNSGWVPGTPGLWLWQVVE